MDLHLRVALACICGLFSFQYISCEDPLEGSSTLNWRCICAASPRGVLNYTPASNCSSSCNCMPDEAGVSDGGGWNCSCALDATAQPYDNIQDASCFTSCNCTYGSPGTPTTAKRHISNTSVIVVLVLCVMLTITAFLCSIACYFCHMDKFSAQPPMVSSGKDSSWNSATNLLSHRSASFPEWQGKNTTHMSPITAFIRRLFFMFGSERGTFPGAIVQFSFAELEEATNKFSKTNLIGLGGSSDVYRGQLKDGRVVAIKRLQLPVGTEEGYGFLTEIELISRLNHCHVIPLRGYCSEYHGKQFERLLVFEFMLNGNLRDCLDARQGKEPMDWATRVGIALGAARGLEYLHEAAAPRILHRDIKSTNILLDDKYRAKITDLGMAKCLMSDDLSSCSSSPARMLGTFGYFAPEYAIVGKASLKSDVFSFGVVILELISGRPPIHKSSNRTDESLVMWATARLRDSKLVVMELPDPLLKGNFPEEEMQIMAHLARECLQWDPDFRPTMSEVVQILSTISPDKSKRKNLPTGLFMQSSAPRRSTNLTEIERPVLPVGRPDIGQSASDRAHDRCSLPLSVERNLCLEQQKNNAEAVLSTTVYMEKLTLLTSPTPSWRSSDEEVVDLTEPRFESFMQVNLQSP
ncbi:receptor-like serine/threonine-protein kinase NCRK [Iris pallida]|uniref:non-specific serine/threonine protein kinase n=1 Tax=Iris pallida TaxID=29817 RepID=A0AAX6ESC8_IRIPA|nr:receptor-like serine/threonine-protein kinase NCRK [Iris pallida]